MDDIVQAALKKWPNVPHCYGWLALDARGDWYMRDERTQQAGPFPRVKGSRVNHDKLLAFIGRNYASDERGAWFFQNGPQRVYVELECTPWIWRLQPGGDVLSHTGRGARAESAWLTRQAISICTPTWASASSTRRTWAWPRRPSRPAAGHRRTASPPSCRPSTATSADPIPKARGQA
jgi:hypothetical protein